jgi:hypothetical protein
MVADCWDGCVVWMDARSDERLFGGWVVRSWRMELYVDFEASGACWVLGSGASTRDPNTEVQPKHRDRPSTWTEHRISMCHSGASQHPLTQASMPRNFSVHCSIGMGLGSARHCALLRPSGSLGIPVISFTR